MGRDHSCEGCGRGGFNDPEASCQCVACETCRGTGAADPFYYPQDPERAGECSDCDGRGSRPLVASGKENDRD